MAERQSAGGVIRIRRSGFRQRLSAFTSSLRSPCRLPSEALIALALSASPALAQAADGAVAKPAQEAPAAKPPAGGGTPATDARPGKIPTSAFARGTQLNNALLSRDGLHLAFSIAKDGVQTIASLSMATRTSDFQFRLSKDQDLNWFRWAGNNKILFSVSFKGELMGEDVHYSRLFAADVTTKKVNFIGRKEQGFIGDDVLFIDRKGDFVLLSIQQSIYDWPAIWKVPLDETAMKASKLVQRQIDGVWDWYADDAGTVREGLEFTPTSVKVHYRKNESEMFRVIATLTRKNWNDKIWDVERIVSGSDEGYAITKEIDGTSILARFNYVTRTVGETIYSSQGGTIEDVYYDANDKPMAVTYSDDHGHVEWLDPKMKRLQTAMATALSGTGVTMTSRTDDGSKMLVWSGDEGDPGALYLFDTQSRHLDLLGEQRQDLQPRMLAKPVAIDYKARDGVKIHAYLTLPKGRPAKNLPLVILPHGGPYGVRDMLVYDDEVQFLANRGYVVLQPNYRGSSGYGEGFEGLGDGQIGRTMQDDLDDGMDDLAKQGIIDPKRVCIVGSSYGGYAAVWGVIRNPERYRCAASFAGVMNWKRQLRYQNSQESEGSERKKWSLRVKGGTDGDFDLDQVLPTKQVARLTRPVLLVHGDKDSRVPFGQFTEMRDAAAHAKVPVQTLVMPDEGHGFDKAEDQELWFTKLEEFLTLHNPAD